MPALTESTNVPSATPSSKPDAGITNHAFFFIKPHANNAAVAALCQKTLAAQKIRVTEEGIITAAEIGNGGLIDKHYGTLAKRAMDVPPLELPVWDAAKAEAFEKTFGTPHAVAAAGNCLDQLPLSTQGSEPPGWLADGVLINLRAAMARLPELSAKELETEWRAGPCLKLAPGTYAAQLLASGLIVINGFYGRCATGHAHSSPSPSRSAATAPWTSP
jgi:hypothetical protein